MTALNETWNSYNMSQDWVSNTTISLEAFTQYLQNTSLFGWEYALPLIITVATILMLTRVPQKMGILLFPITVGYGIIGLQNHWAIYMLSSILYIQGSLGFGGITQLANTAFTKAKGFFGEDSYLRHLRKGQEQALLRKRREEDRTYKLEGRTRAAKQRKEAESNKKIAALARMEAARDQELKILEEKDAARIARLNQGRREMNELGFALSDKNPLTSVRRQSEGESELDRLARLQSRGNIFGRKSQAEEKVLRHISRIGQATREDLLTRERMRKYKRRYG